MTIPRILCIIVATAVKMADCGQSTSCRLNGMEGTSSKGQTVMPHTARTRHLLPALALATALPASVLVTNVSRNSTGSQFAASANWTQGDPPVDFDGSPEVRSRARWNFGNSGSQWTAMTAMTIQRIPEWYFRFRQMFV